MKEVCRVSVAVFTPHYDERHHEIEAGQRLKVMSGASLGDNRIEKVDRRVKLSTPKGDAAPVCRGEAAFEAVPVRGDSRVRESIENVLSFSEQTRLSEGKARLDSPSRCVSGLPCRRASSEADRNRAIARGKSLRSLTSAQPSKNSADG